ncbi:MAG: HD domain-containing protein [Clostridia bacterium]|nr:HD domain-containing protein [Clostridia bacterium]
MKGLFSHLAATPDHKDWEQLTARRHALYQRETMRDEFYRDYTRILHCTAFRRLKHKTQVFPHVESDHICTRMEHVLHVESVSNTVAEHLGLNTSLTRAISMGHDIGHAPFGHEGEKVLSSLAEEHLGRRFWHEQNGLRFADGIELLQDPKGVWRNLGLTYAVRDGILCHCGEVDENALRPREELLDLASFTRPGEHQSATWEGCVVKLADKIAYLGRDIEDAAALGFLGDAGRAALSDLQKRYGMDPLNTTGIMHTLICDVCATSTPERGIALSHEACTLMDEVKALNYEYIYTHPRFVPFRRYARLVIEEVFVALAELYTGKPYPLADAVVHFPTLVGGFANFVRPYLAAPLEGYDNEKLYGDLSDRTLYLTAVTDYIAGMTDAFLIRAYTELVSF